MYRKFWLVNSNGDKWDLTDKETFGASPSGLGISNNYASIRLGNSDLVTFLNHNLNEVGLTLLFFGDNNSDIYQKYNLFIQFISFLPIKLHYQPPFMNGDDSYYRETIVSSIDKTEIKSNASYLACETRFKPQTLWRSSKENIIEVSSEYAKGKRYPLRRPYSYGGNSVENITLINNSTQDAPLIVEIQGAAENPLWLLYDFGAKLYGASKFFGEYEHVIVNANDLEESISLFDGYSNIPNPASYQDLEIGSPNEIYVTFLKLKPGRNTMIFNFDNTFTGSVIIKWRDEYVSV